MLIDGEWVATEATFPSVDPSTGGVIAEVALAGAKEVTSAVAAARRALPAWRALECRERIDCLNDLLVRLRDAYGQEGERTSLKTLIQREVGKRLPEADIEVAESADVLEYFLRSAPAQLAPQTLELDRGLWPTKTSLVEMEPVGVVAIIKPWNYPLELPIWAIAPALVAGNTVVFKPAEDAALVGIALAELAGPALPPGVLNVVSGDGDVGRALVQADIDMVAFTGSGSVGIEIAEHCAQRMRRCTLELGGIDPAIVAGDADLELTANGLVWGAFANAGQVCVRPKRVIVDRAIADELVELIVAKTEALKTDVDYGPLINERQLARVEGQVAGSAAAGAQIRAGGARLADRAGFYYAPTVLDHADMSLSVCREECFGPVMPILRVENLDRAVEIANSSEYGLGASVWSSDAGLAERVARQLDCGMVWVNDVNVAFPQAPWGGRKLSGLGAELGAWGLSEFVKPKHISTDSSESQRRDWWFPYQAD
jgi:acyl-CoA reductase-like NAD-dependent aldehyde dehydrogenase